MSLSSQLPQAGLVAGLVAGKTTAAMHTGQQIHHGALYCTAKVEQGLLKGEQ